MWEVTHTQARFEGEAWPPLCRFDRGLERGESGRNREKSCQREGALEHPSRALEPGRTNKQITKIKFYRKNKKGIGYGVTCWRRATWASSLLSVFCRAACLSFASRTLTPPRVFWKKKFRIEKFFRCIFSITWKLGYCISVPLIGIGIYRGWSILSANFKTKGKLFTL